MDQATIARKKETTEYVHELVVKYYGDQGTDPVDTGLSRNEMMIEAKERGIKNFRILNKEELMKVLEMKKSGATDEQIKEQVVDPAVARWKSGCKTAIAAVMLCLCFIKGVEAKEMDHTKAVIHHTAGSKETARDLTVEEIDRYHKERGWDGIGYHFVIRKDGTVEYGRDINKIGAHAKGRNEYIGIALTGFDEFTEAQIWALKKMLIKLGVMHIERHHEDCPGPGIDVESIQKWLEDGDL